MKTKHLAFIALALVCLFCSCEKEDEQNSLNPEGKDLRIKEIQWENSTLPYDKAVFSYEGENLISTIYYASDGSGGWIEAYKDEYLYNSNTITELGYEKNGESWSEISNIERVVENGMIVEEVQADKESGNWQESWKWTFQYSGSGLSAWQASYNMNNNGVFEPVQKGEYVYSGGLPNEHLEYEANNAGTFSPAYKEVFYNDGGRLSYSVRYKQQSSEWVKYSKVAYSYSGDNISRIDYYNWADSQNEWYLEYYYTYKYDENAYLIKQSGYEEDITYVYEEGIGNAGLLYFIPWYGINFEPGFKSTSKFDRRRLYPNYHKF